LVHGQSCGTLGSRRMKPQIAVKPAQFFAARDELGCGQGFILPILSVYRPDPRTGYVQEFKAKA